MIQLNFFRATTMAAGLQEAAEKLLLAPEWEGHEFTRAANLWGGRGLSR